MSGSGASLAWVESMGGPLVAVPISALTAWHGCTESGVIAGDATPWEECGLWTVDGPAVLMDATEAGTELDAAYPDGRMPAQAPVPLPAGRWRVLAVHTRVDDGTWVGLVRLLPAGP